MLFLNPWLKEDWLIWITVPPLLSSAAERTCVVAKNSSPGVFFEPLIYTNLFWCSWWTVYLHKMFPSWYLLNIACLFIYLFVVVFLSLIRFLLRASCHCGPDFNFLWSYPFFVCLFFLHALFCICILEKHFSLPHSNAQQT